MYHAVTPSEARLELVYYLLGSHQVEAALSVGVRFCMPYDLLSVFANCFGWQLVTGANLSPGHFDTGKFVTGGKLFRGGLLYQGAFCLGGLLPYVAF